MDASKILSKHEHCYKLMTKIFDMMNNPTLCDMSIAVETDVFNVHKCVFVAASPAVQSIVTKEAEKDSSPSNIHLSLDGISVREFKALALYVYTGEFPEESNSEKNKELISACGVFDVTLPKTYLAKYEKNGDNKIDGLKEIENVSPVDTAELINAKDSEVDDADDCSNFSEKDIDSNETLNNTLEHNALTEHNYQSPKKNSKSDEVKIFNSDTFVTLQRHYRHITFCDITEISKNKNRYQMVEASSIAPLFSVVKRKRSFPGEIKQAQYSSPKIIKFNPVIVSKEARNVSNAPLIRCSFKGCDKSFYSKLKLKSHRRCHNEKKFVCITCGKKFQSIKDLTTHGRIHTKEMPFVCLIKCNASFTQKVSLKNHLVTHEKTKETFSCNLCSRKYTSARGLHYHFKYKHDTKKPQQENMETFDCDLCDKKYTSSGGLYHHVKHGHSTSDKEKRITNSNDKDRVKPYRCSICCSFFTRKDTLEYHMATHDEARLAVECQICQKIYKSHKSFNHHLKVMHPNCNTPFLRKGWNSATPNQVPLKEILRTFSCNLCTKKYATERSLQSHFKNKHDTTATKTVDNIVNTIAKPFQCLVCNSEFTRKDSLAYHVSTHCQTQEDIECPSCHKIYKSFKTFNNHIKECHSGSGIKHLRRGDNSTTVLDVPESCKPIFRQRSNVNTSLMPECNICHINVNSMKQYRAHMRNKHSKTI